MTSENFNELMRLIMDSDWSRIAAAKKHLDLLDGMTEWERRISFLYLALEKGEHSLAKQIVDTVRDVKRMPSSPPSSTAVKPAIKPLPRPKSHPPVKSWPDGGFLAESIRAFAIFHKPPLKYEGMHTAIDVLTACRSPEGDWYDFHYEIKAYKRNDGVYIQKVPGKGHRTSPEDTDNLER